MSERLQLSKTIFDFLLTFVQMASFLEKTSFKLEAGDELIKKTKLQQGTSAVCVDNYSWWDSFLGIH